jgi:iron complex outermembrane receptor protein
MLDLKKILLGISLVFAISSLLSVTEETSSDSLEVRKVYDLDRVIFIWESPDRTIGNVNTRSIKPHTVNTEASIGDLLKDMPGLFLTEKSKGESIVRFRGFEDRHIRVFIDGMPISDGYFGNYDLHLLSANNVSQVQLIKGPVSHQYGFNTMGGILNIITDDLREENALRTRLLYSSHERVQLSLNTSYALGRSQFYLNSSFLKTPGFILPRKMNTFQENSLETEGKRRSNAEREQYNINLRYITDIAGLHTFTFTTGYSYIPEKGNPPSIYFHPDDRYSRIEKWQKKNASLAVSSSMFEGFEISASSFYDESEDTYIRFNDPLFTNPSWESLIRTNTLGLHLNVNHTKGRYLQNDFGIRFEQKGYERTGGPGYENIWVDNSQTLTKIYHTLRYPVERESFSLIAGNALSSFTHSNLNGYNHYFEPQAGLNYYFRDQSVSLAYGISYQFPTMQELFSESSGNPELKAEKAYKTEASYRSPFSLAGSKGTFNLTLFHNKVDDLIRRDRTLFYNQEKMSSYGGEVHLQWSPFPVLIHDYEISFLKLDKKNSSVQLLEYPEVKLKFNHQLALSKSINLNLSTQWYDRSYTFYRDDDFHTLPAYWIHDFGIKYLHSRFNTTLNISNLLDNYYEPQYGYPAAGREITLAIELPIF